ncbi:Phage major capsid protein, HK97 [Bosea sp. LC85]|uniref:phage major capsid protein n=1 Tax=Bosea sp. LC85 TaxID=1502851 RepID=UPI0004E41645|nr:phage major capsid protein [Bosea sp. LC85]KFC73204.1 Phage major capsid protein, HK97 [Bosea sp. LC85]
MLKELRAKRTKLVADMRAIIVTAEGQDRDLTAEEQASFDELQASRDALENRITRLEAQETSEAALDAVVPARSRSSVPQVIPRRPNEASTEFESFGEFMAAVRFNRNDQRLNFVEGVGAATDENGLQAEMRMDNDTQGGFMVPQQFRNQIFRVEAQASLVRPRAQIIPAGSPPDASITMPALDQSGANPANMFGGVQVQWIEEGEEKPETDAKLGEITLTPHEVAGFVTVTDKLLRNWQASDTFIRNLLSGAVDAAEDYSFLRGNGVTQPLGALNAGAMKYVNRANANTVGYLDLLGMVAVLLMRGGSPIWSAPQSALPKIATLQDPEGHYIWKPDARDGFAGTLLGYPLRWNNRAPALGSKGDIVLADWNYYLIKDGSGPFVAASEHVKFTSNKTVIKIFWNVDGAPWMKGPIKEENGYEVSPFIGLDIPA